MSNLSGSIERLNLNDTPATAAAAATNTDGVAASDIAPEDRKTILACFADIIALIDRLDKESSDPLPTTIQIDSTRLTEYSDVLSHAITKFVLFVSQGEAGVLVASREELSNHLSGISCLLRSLLHPSSNAGGIVAGRTQCREILSVHQKLFTGIRAILTQLQAHMLAKKSTKLDVSLTGRTWQVCEKDLKSTPLSNATAVGRAINKQCSIIKDAQTELDEIHVSTGDSEDEEQELPPEADDEDALFIDAGGDDALTEEEFRIVPSVKSLTTTAHTLVKSLYMYLLKVKIDERQARNIDWLELVLSQVETIGVLLDDLIGSLYAPQDRSKVRTAAEALVLKLRSNALSIVQHNVDAGAEWPMKSAPGATPSSEEAFSGCPACKATLEAATAMKPAGDEQHAHRIEWLKKVITQIHAGHAMVDACQ